MKRMIGCLGLLMLMGQPGTACEVALHVVDFRGMPTRIELIDIVDDVTDERRQARSIREEIEALPGQEDSARYLFLFRRTGHPFAFGIRYHDRKGLEQRAPVYPVKCGDHFTLVVGENRASKRDREMRVSGVIENCGCYKGLWVHMAPLFGGRARANDLLHEAEVDERTCRFELRAKGWGVMHSFVVGAGNRSLVVFDRLLRGDGVNDLGAIRAFDRECKAVWQ